MDLPTRRCTPFESLASIFIPGAIGRNWRWYRRVQGGRWCRIFRQKLNRNGTPFSGFYFYLWRCVPECSKGVAVGELYPDKDNWESERTECTAELCLCEFYP